MSVEIDKIDYVEQAYKSYVSVSGNGVEAYRGTFSPGQKLYPETGIDGSIEAILEMGISTNEVTEVSKAKPFLVVLKPTPEPAPAPVEEPTEDSEEAKSTRGRRK